MRGDLDAASAPRLNDILQALGTDADQDVIVDVEELTFIDSKLLRTQRTLPAKLESVVAIARRTVPNCDAAGISLLIDGQPTTAAVSDRFAVEVDLVLNRLRQTPGSARSHRRGGLRLLLNDSG